MIRVGFIGAGQIAAIHSQTVADVDGAQVAGVYDIDSDRCAGLADKFAATAFGTMESLLKNVDAVFICTPPSLHREAAVAAAGAGVHVFCEKPLAARVEDAEAIADAVRRSGISFMTGFVFRFSPGYRRLKAIVSRGDLGRVHSFFATRMLNLPHLAPNWRTHQAFVCGMTMESLSHDFDLMRWLVGNPVSVYGLTSTDRPDLDGYDNITSVVMKLESGAMGSLHSNWVSRLSISEHGVVGSGGTAVAQNYPGWIVRSKLAGDNDESVDHLDSPEDRTSGHTLETLHFLDHLTAATPLIATVDDGLATVRISTAVLQSAREGRAIALQW